MTKQNIVSADNAANKQFYCKQIDAETNVCDWYECPYGNVCDTINIFFRHLPIDDDPDYIQEIDGVIFYTPKSMTAPLLTRAERAEVYARWEREQ